MKLSRIFLISMLIVIIFLAGCSSSSVTNNPIIEQGTLDLTHWEFVKDGSIKLNGKWEFYWNKLLNYEDLEKERPDLFAEVPNTWNSYSLNGAKLPGQGFATYRLHVNTDLPAGTLFGLRIYTFSSAYQLFVNEKLVASNGKVATKSANEVGQYRPQAVFFNTPASEFDIIIQVSNFQYARGGFWYTMTMGSPGEIFDLHDNIVNKEVFLQGALLITSLFYFAIFILRRELKYTLYFAILCLLIAVGIDMVGQFNILKFFPGISFNLVIFLWYSAASWLVFFLILFVHELYPSRMSGIIVKAYLGIYILLQLVYIITPSIYYTKTGLITNYLEIAGVLSTVIIVAVGIKKGDQSGWLNISSMVIVLLTYIHDVLYWTNVISSNLGEIYYLGIFLFILIQMVIQAHRIKLYHEQKVAAELRFLQAQIKPHFLFNSLNTFISISYYDMDKARNLLTEFSNYLRRTFDFKDLRKFVPIKNEIELAKAYVEIERARFEERIEVTFEVPDNLEVRVPIFMFQPLIENAVIHGILPKPEGGRVDITVKKEGRMLFFKVKDNGIGMTPEKLKGIFKRGNEQGVGLANIDKRLKKLFGKGLEIASSQDGGTEITWRIPI